MTEAEWLSSTDVQDMYVFLRDTTTLFRTRWQGHRPVLRYAFSERKSRLFATACCRRILHLIPGEPTRARLVDAAERFADGQVPPDEFLRAFQAWRQEWATRLRRGGFRPWPHEREAIDAVSRLHETASGGRGGVMRAARAAWAWSEAVLHKQHGQVDGPHLAGLEYARQADLLRDIAGNPFRSATVDRSWLAWNDRCVERMARGIYEETAFDRLPILHDALLDAGCDNEDILAHCRSPQEHVRGCWVVDLLLGKG
jgi:hypothetical protein